MQPKNPDFFSATVPGVKNTSLSRNGARASGFAARPAVKPCGESWSGSGGGDSGRGARSGIDRRAAVAGLELVDRYSAGHTTPQG